MKQQLYIQKYELIKKIGEGSFSKVYLCKHRMLDGYRAIKTIKKTVACREDILKEAKMLQELECPFIPIVYDIFEDDNNMYIVMEYVEGSSLYELALSKKITYSNILDYMISICKLYEFFNKTDIAVVYTDLKPENIMVCGEDIKLVDFDSAFYQWELKKRKRIPLTKKYTSPEQLQFGMVNEKTSIYSIGKILEFLLEHVKKSSSLCNMNYCEKQRKALNTIARKATSYYSFYRFEGVSSLKRRILQLKYQDSTHNSNIIYPIRIGVIGSQSRIGVTHLTFLLATYFNIVGLSSIYINYNNSNDMRPQIKKRKGYEYGMEVEHIPYTTKQIMNQHSVDEYNIQLYDFGEFNYRDSSMYETMNLLFGVVGTKSWEVFYTDNLLHRLSIYPRITYVCNYANMEGYHKFVKGRENYQFLRMPMNFDPFIVEQNSVLITFLEEVYDLTMGEKYNEKNKKPTI